MVDAVSGPAYAEFYEPQVVAFDQTLTLIRVERPANCEDAPRVVQVIDEDEANG